MRIAIVGSRGYAHLDDVAKLVAFIRKDEPKAVIVSGGASGVDMAAETAARDQNLGVLSYRVQRVDDESYGIQEWRYGNTPVFTRLMAEQPTLADHVSALFYRNTLIVDSCDRLVAFWDSSSPGTQFTIGYARDQGKPVKIYTDRDRLPL